MMGSRKTRMTLTIDPEIKSSCQEVLRSIGVPLSRAVEGYLSALAQKGSFPVTVEALPSTDPRSRERYLAVKRREQEDDDGSEG